MLRIGQGLDVHAFSAGDHVMLGGVRIPYARQFEYPVVPEHSLEINAPGFWRHIPDRVPDVLIAVLNNDQDKPGW